MTLSGERGTSAIRRFVQQSPFPSPQELWDLCFPEGNDWRERFQSFFQSFTNVV